MLTALSVSTMTRRLDRGHARTGPTRWRTTTCETGSGAVRAKWRGLLRCAGWAAIASVALTCLQLIVFIVWPPPQTVAEMFDLMMSAPWLGLVSLDLLYLVNNLAVWLFYLGLCIALAEVSPSVTLIAGGVGTLQMSSYLASNPSVEIYLLAHRHADASPQAQVHLAAAGEAVMAGWKGTAFVTYYVLGALVLLLFAWLLHRSTVFGRVSSWWALAAGLLMVIPSTFGTVGLLMSLSSLLPWNVVCILLGVQLLRLSADPSPGIATTVDPGASVTPD